jgi:hypothetical protein
MDFYSYMKEKNIFPLKPIIEVVARVPAPCVLEVRPWPSSINTSLIGARSNHLTDVN